jgi:uncharacterized phage infection (PIP) family protein YhgE
MNVQVDVDTLKKVAAYISTTQPLVEKSAQVEGELAQTKTDLKKVAASHQALLGAVADLLIKNRVVDVEKRAEAIKDLAEKPSFMSESLAKLAANAGAMPSLGSGVPPATGSSSNGDEFDQFVRS